MAQTKFTVVIPAYNAIDTIDRAVNSVLKQTYKDYEVVIVENGSIDGTKVYCEKFLTDKRIRLIHSEKGVSRARNAGIDIAQGKWVVFLDADDELVDDALTTFINLDHNKDDILIGARVFGEHKVKNELDTHEYFMHTNKEYLYESLANPTQECVITKCAFNREFLIRNDIKFDEQLTYAEDSVFLVKCLLAADSIMRTHKEVYRVHYDETSSIRSNSGLEYKYIGAINKVRELLQLEVAENSSFINYYYLFAIAQLLVVMVNNIFKSDALKKDQIESARKAADIDVYKEALENVDLNNCKYLGKSRKIVYKWLKDGKINKVYLAAKLKQLINKYRA